MSVLTKTPYINNVISGISDKAAFLSLLNTSIENFEKVGFTKTDKKISSLSNGIHAVELRTGYYEPLKYGYLIKGTTIVFLSFAESGLQNRDILNIYEIEGVSLKKINEYLDAAELRNLLVDAGQSAGTVVVANPTLAGGESALESVQIGTEKFSVGGSGGTKWYKHTITQPKTLVDASTWHQPTYIIYSTSNTPITTVSELKTALKTLPNIISADVSFGQEGTDHVGICDMRYSFGTDRGDRLVNIANDGMSGELITSAPTDVVTELQL